MKHPQSFLVAKGQLLVLFEFLVEWESNELMYQAWVVKGNSVDDSYPKHLDMVVARGSMTTTYRVPIVFVKDMTKDSHTPSMILSSDRSVTIQYLWKDGDLLDVRDTQNTWCNAVICQTMSSPDGAQYLIHYTEFSSRWDEWISHVSPRLRMHATCKGLKSS